MKKLYLLFFAFFFAGSIETCFASDKEDMSDEETNEFKPQSKVVIENNKISSDFMENRPSYQEFYEYITDHGTIQIPPHINSDVSSDDCFTKRNPFSEENKNVEMEKDKKFTTGKTSTPKKNSNRNRRTNNFNKKNNHPKFK